MHEANDPDGKLSEGTKARMEPDVYIPGGLARTPALVDSFALLSIAISMKRLADNADAFMAMMKRLEEESDG